MAKQDIKYGDFAGDTNPSTTELARESFRKAKENFDELYARPTGDMHKSLYDADNDGVVDSADKIETVDAAGNKTFYGKDENGNIGFHTVTADYNPPAPYNTKSTLLADQANQIENEVYYVEDASDWTGISSGWATFQKKASSTASESDYILRDKEDSVKDIQDSSGVSIVDEFGVAKLPTTNPNEVYTYSGSSIFTVVDANKVTNVYRNGVLTNNWQVASTTSIDVLGTLVSNDELTFSYSKGYGGAALTRVKSIQTWGDSITYEGAYQTSLSNELLGIPVKNAGIQSDYSQHIRKRFISYFTDENPFIGTGTYTVPSLSERQQELQDSFFVFWIGTNNLLNFDRAGGGNTTGNTDYNNLQPNPDFKYDRLYAKAYIDQYLKDIKIITEKIPHGNFAIIGGHNGGKDTLNEMKVLDELVTRTYPRNVINIRELLLFHHDYQDVYLSADFVKPALNNSVTISLTKTSWIGNGLNPSSDICIGTKEIYDKYKVNSKTATTVEATLIESNTEFTQGDTIRASYNLVSDLGRDEVTINTQVFSFEDCDTFNSMAVPKSSTTDGIHFTSDAYTLIGKLIAKEIQKINR